MKLLENGLFKRVVAIFCCLYGVFLAWLGYMSVFYKISYVNKPVFAFIYVSLTLVFLAVMFFVRKHVITTILSMIMMVLIVPVVFMNLGDWLLIIPPIFLVVMMFFANGANETVKTVFGTIFLLFYIVCGLGFFVVANIFTTTKAESYQTLAEGVSNTGAYRYYVVDVQDNSGGRTEVYVEPNDRDKDFGSVQFKINGFAQRKYYERDHNMPNVEWRDGDTLYINNKRYEIKEWKWEFKLN